ncbi:MAG TPA: dephospho-CoA kinase [Anaerolineales bacterium]
MSAWPGKYLIGLTGNIATGKSVVRKMLEHLGAYGIDADALAHRAIAKDAPGYKPVVDAFGTWILDPDGQVDRAKLGRIVFADPGALARLESIVHPLVAKAVDLLVRRSKHKVVVVEAIKLLESGLGDACDSIWVTVAPQDVQLARLVQRRGLDAQTAQDRIRAQPPQADKVAAAQIIIYNEGTYEQAWQQVIAAWKETVPSIDAEAQEPLPAKAGELVVERARLQHVDAIAAFINRYSRGRRQLSRQDLIAALGEKAFLLLKVDDRLVGLVGWQVENLVARTSDVYLQPAISLENAMALLMQAVERASRELQCEASLLFLPPHLARHEDVWRAQQYELRTIPGLKIRAWQEAAEESMPEGTVMLFKQLRKDRVLRPV